MNAVSGHYGHFQRAVREFVEHYHRMGVMRHPKMGIAATFCIAWFTSVVL